MQFQASHTLGLIQGYFLLFGLVTLLGGVMGYVKAKSVASLLAGGLSGALLLGAACLLPSRPAGGAILGLVVSMALLGRFTPALLRGKKMPAAYLVPLSALGVILAFVLLLASGG